MIKSFLALFMALLLSGCAGLFSGGACVHGSRGGGCIQGANAQAVVVHQQPVYVQQQRPVIIQQGGPVIVQQRPYRDINDPRTCPSGWIKANGGRGPWQCQDDLQPQQQGGIFQQFNQLQQAQQCPPNSYWDGRGCFCRRKTQDGQCLPG